mgnify:CR=1 FL=1
MPNWFINIRSKGAKKAGREIKGLTGNLNGMASAAKKAAVVFGVGFLGKQIFDIGKSAVNTAAQFETLRVRLGNMYGSVQRGTQAFDAFNKVAATTPFQLANVVEAGASLKAFGVDAENMIKPVSDLAAFMGVDVVEAAQAMGRAFAGGASAADVLRDRGILKLVEDSTEGIGKLTDLTMPEFQRVMTEALTDPSVGIAGATTKLADTWSGAVSNFQDGIDRLKAAIGDELIKALRPKLDKINQLLSTFGEIGWDNIGSAFASNMEFFTDYAQRLAGLGGEIIGRSLMQGIFTAMAESGPIIQRSVADMFSFLPGIAGLMNLTANATEFLGQSFVKNADQSQEIMDAWADIQMTASTMMGNWIILAEEQSEVTDKTTNTINSETKAIKTNTEVKKKAVEITKTQLQANSELMKGSAAFLKQFAGGFRIAARLQQTAAAIDAWSAANAAIAPPPKGYGPTPIGWTMFAASIASGMANVMSISKSIGEFSKAATGADFVTSGPQMLMVGDNPGGREQVSVTPLSSPNIDGPQGGGSITLNISAPLVDETVVDSIIPAIEKAQRLNLA